MCLYDEHVQVGKACRNTHSGTPHLDPLKRSAHSPSFAADPSALAEAAGRAVDSALGSLDSGALEALGQLPPDVRLSSLLGVSTVCAQGGGKRSGMQLRLRWRHHPPWL